MSDNAHPAPATRRSWSKVRPLPAERARLVVEREFTEQEYARIARGLVPEVMEDRWFIFLEDTTLCFHRSWTGHCIFLVTLARLRTGYAIAEVLVNRDPSQYSGGSDSHDERLLLFLIDHLLLGERRPLPMPSGVPAGIASELHHHHVAGAGPGAPGSLESRDLWRWLWHWSWWLIRRP